jgi:hypothetical protein
VCGDSVGGEPVTPLAILISDRHSRRRHTPSSRPPDCNQLITRNTG